MTGRERMRARYYPLNVCGGSRKRAWGGGAPISDSPNPEGHRCFLAHLTATDTRVSANLGRLEHRPGDNPTAKELAQYLAGLKTRLDHYVYKDLIAISQRYRKTSALVEKAVDVKLAVDMVMMAQRDEYDAAYLLSADGDFTPAVEAARVLNKKVHIASPSRGAQLAKAADSYIRMPLAWFDHSCYRA